MNSLKQKKKKKKQEVRQSEQFAVPFRIIFLEQAEINLPFVSNHLNYKSTPSCQLLEEGKHTFPQVKQRTGIIMEKTAQETKRKQN
jgi:hypothetical protein